MRARQQQVQEVAEEVALDAGQGAPSALSSGTPSRSDMGSLSGGNDGAGSESVALASEIVQFLAQQQPQPEAASGTLVAAFEQRVSAEQMPLFRHMLKQVRSAGEEVPSIR
jgi:hypothetical protein